MQNNASGCERERVLNAIK